MVRRLLCLLLVEPQIREKKFDPRTPSEFFGDIPFETVVKTAEEMEDAGSRYKNLEQALGTGIVFILGKDIPETHWTKFLPKSGEKFDGVVSHIKNTCYPIPIASLGELRRVVIRQKISDLMTFNELPEHHAVSQNDLHSFASVNLNEIHYQQQCYSSNPAELLTEACTSSNGMPPPFQGDGSLYHYNWGQGLS